MSNATIRDYTLASQAIGKTMRIRVTLPPDFAGLDAQRLYPVVYLLHQWGRNERYWTERLHIHERLAAGIAAGTLPPMLLAMPEGDKSFYLNAADPPGHNWADYLGEGEFFDRALDLYGCYGDYLLHEAIPFIEQNFPVRTDRAGRAIGGVSMGGAAAAVHAFGDPGRFCAVGIHAPALFDDVSLAPPWIFGFAVPSFAERNPAHLAKRYLTPENQPRLWLDCGWDDTLRGTVEALHQTLLEGGIVHDYHLWPGAHNSAYWQAHVDDYLGFYAREWLQS